MSAGKSPAQNVMVEFFRENRAIRLSKIIETLKKLDGY